MGGQGGVGWGEGLEWVGRVLTSLHLERLQALCCSGVVQDKLQW